MIADGLRTVISYVKTTPASIPPPLLVRGNSQPQTLHRGQRPLCLTLQQKGLAILGRPARVV
jgi:hypothetical protein